MLLTLSAEALLMEREQHLVHLAKHKVPFPLGSETLARVPQRNKHQREFVVCKLCLPWGKAIWLRSLATINYSGNTECHPARKLGN